MLSNKNKKIATWGFYAMFLGGLFYASSRTLGFVTNTMPADKQYLGYLFLLFTGIGSLIWLAVYLNYANGSNQRAVAFVMAILDLVGELVLMYADTVKVSSDNGLLKMSQDDLQIFIYASFGIVALNVMAAFVFKLSDPEKEKEERKKDRDEKIEEMTKNAWMEAMDGLETPESKKRMQERMIPVMQDRILREFELAIMEQAGLYARGAAVALPAEAKAGNLQPVIIPPVTENGGDPDKKHPFTIGGVTVNMPNAVPTAAPTSVPPAKEVGSVSSPFQPE